MNSQSTGDDRRAEHYMWMELRLTNDPDDT